MLLLMFYISIPLILVLILMMLNLLISKKTQYDQEKLSTFECGFEIMKTPRTPFSMHFYLILLMFLIFDVEFMLLLPMIITSQFINSIQWMALSIIFILILLLGLMMEWHQQMLKWY